MSCVLPAGDSCDQADSQCVTGRPCSHTAVIVSHPPVHKKHSATTTTAPDNLQQPAKRVRGRCGCDSAGHTGQAPPSPPDKVSMAVYPPCVPLLQTSHSAMTRVAGYVTVQPAAGLLYPLLRTNQARPSLCYVLVGFLLVLLPQLLLLPCLRAVCHSSRRVRCVVRLLLPLPWSPPALVCRSPPHYPVSVLTGSARLPLTLWRHSPFPSVASFVSVHQAQLSGPLRPCPLPASIPR